MLTESYNKSYAIVIGINKYPGAPLNYAMNDALEFSNILVEKLGFDKQNVQLLLDGDATRGNIMSSYMKLASFANINDRIILYFAGHGLTVPAVRKDIGYLVPIDGNLKDLSTLIRWDELTQNSELIVAKHIFFILDACFSGLALTRTMAFGSVRYVKDMLTRYSRQVLTGGKGNEAVSDANGPLPEHSIFTGYLIHGICNYKTEIGEVLTANNLMAYVHDKVSRDLNSKQTPHFGYFDGDGDIILSKLDFEKEAIDGEDSLIEIRNAFIDDRETTLVEEVKEFISDDKYRIKLDSLVTGELKKYLAQIDESYLPMNSNEDFNKEITSRFQYYDEKVVNILTISVLLAHWGKDSYSSIFRKILSRVTDNIKEQGGNTLLLNSRYYPLMILLYSILFGCITSKNIDMLKVLIEVKFNRPSRYDKNYGLIDSIVKGALELDRSDVFNNIPEKNRYHAPRSEYLFKRIQPNIDDLLFVGTDYDNIFDIVEILIALYYAYETENENRVWGPPGRFGWKSHNDDNVYKNIVDEALRQGDEWWVLKAGMFGGSIKEFERISERYRNELLVRLNWF